jgi:hypothetical protein
MEKNGLADIDLEVEAGGGGGGGTVINNNIPGGRNSKLNATKSIIHEVCLYSFPPSFLKSPGGGAPAPAPPERPPNGRRLTKVSASTKLAATVGNSKGAQLGRKYQTVGMTKSVTTQLKRRYYRAGIRLDSFTADSFTPEFKADALFLASNPFNFNRTMEFISKYGEVRFV